MTLDQRLVSEQFPRASQYHPDWVIANASGGANSLWLTEWLTVPNQILIGAFAKLRLYGFQSRGGRFPKLLRILENVGARGLGRLPGALSSDGIGPEVQVVYDGGGVFCSLAWY